MALANSTGTAPTHSRPGTPRRLAELYREHVIEKKREPRFLIAVSYLIAIGVVRFITHSIKNHWFTFIFRDVAGSGGAHFHHFAIGILILLAVGYIAVAFNPEREGVQRTLAILFGIGAALVLDEFALWLIFKDVYWGAQGRFSVDAVLIVGSLITIIATGRGLLLEVGHDMQELFGGGKR